MYYLGIDGGGTKSRLAAVDENNNILGRFEGLSTNLSSNPEEVVSNNLKNITDEFLKASNENHSDCKGLCIGSAGIDLPENALNMKNILKSLGFKCPVLAVNDADIILWAEMRAEPGAVIISGTGSVAYGKDEEGNVARCGGWGHLLDDAGSGYWIGKEAVRRGLRAFDGRGRDTVLTRLLQNHFKIDSIEEIITLIYNNDFGKQNIASLASLTEKGLQYNDRVCREILNEAAEDLFEMLRALFDRLVLKDIPSKIILSGGNILNNKYMKNILLERIRKEYKNASVTDPVQEPVMGAVYLARETAVKPEWRK